MDFLNLDEFATEVTRKVQILGEEYPIVEQTVGMMVDAIAAAKKAEAEGTDKGEQVFSEMVTLTMTVCPDCPKEVFRRMNMKQLTALLEFAMAPDNKVVGNSELPETEDVEPGKSE